MKQLVLMMVSLFLISSAYAQDKEALKAQKEAQKEAESTLKKAKNMYEMSIPNAQYGRKVTDFQRLATALEMSQSTINNEFTKNNALTWKVAADIQNEYYKKLDNEIKADPDNESLQENFVEVSAKLLTYCIKYDSLLSIQPKLKPEEYKAAHTLHQNMSVNPAIQLLQAAQKYSNSESQEDLKKGAMYSSLFLYALEESSLMKDFKHDNLDDWKTYAKAFRAQSYLNLEGTPEAKIVEVYKKLMDTRYKGIAYQSLANYYREKDIAKQNQYLAEGIEALKDDPEQKELRANFAIILMQNQFQKGEKEAFKKTAKLIKEEFSDNSNAVNAYMMEGQIAFEDKQYDEAKAIFLEAKEKFPEEPKCLLMAARSAWQKAIVSGSKKADMDEAIRLFKQLEAEEADEPELWGESLYILYNNTQQLPLAAKYKKYYKGK